MPAQLTTRAQVNGYRFLLRRLEHAMVRRDVRMLHDPMSSQSRSLMVGLIIGLLITAGCAVLALIHPQGAVGDAHIIVGKQSGALYVVVDGTLHPVLNLASARLVAGNDETPASVADSKLASMPRGSTLGIPGAPGALLGPRQGADSNWTLCNTVNSSQNEVTTTAITGVSVPTNGAREVGDDEALLVSHDNTTFLLYHGVRATVDTNNPAIVRALGLGGLTPRPATTGLIDATIEVPTLTPPIIDRQGAPGPLPGTNLRVGSVVKVIGVNSTDYYVVLANGVQRISPFTAEVIRDANSQGLDTVAEVPPDVITSVPIVDSLPVDRFPVQRPTIISADADSVSCIAWSRKATDRNATLRFLVGMQLPLPSGAVPVPMVSPAVGRADAAYVPPSSGEYVQATGINPGSTRRDSLFYVSDGGIRYGIPDTGTAKTLGLNGPPVLAPWQILDQLVAGPTLVRSDALVARDTFSDVAADK